jgi:CBS domain-containing protein
VVREAEDLQAVLHAFADCRSDVLPIVDAAGHLRGVVELSTLRPLLATTDRYAWLLAHDLMQAPPATLGERTSLLAAQRIFDAADAESVPVLDERGECVVGMASIRHLVRKADEVAAEWFASHHGGAGGSPGAT